jgi:hypothetical protein
MNSEGSRGEAFAFGVLFPSIEQVSNCYQRTGSKKAEHGCIDVIVNCGTLEFSGRTSSAKEYSVPR